MLNIKTLFRFRLSQRNEERAIDGVVDSATINHLGDQDNILLILSNLDNNFSIPSVVSIRASECESKVDYTIYANQIITYNMSIFFKMKVSKLSFQLSSKIK